MITFYRLFILFKKWNLYHETLKKHLIVTLFKIYAHVFEKIALSIFQSAFEFYLYNCLANSW